MTRLAACSVACALLLLSTPASSVTVDLVDGTGSLTWDTHVSVTSPTDNTSVTHPLFPGNRHPHEGWFVYLPDFGLLHEFTAFSVTSDGASQDSMTSTWTTVFGEDITLDLTYGITAVGPDGLPNLDWSGLLSRPLNPVSPFPTITARLFNVFDYDVGDVLGADSATVTQTTGPNTTLVEIEGAGGITGQRGAFANVAYSVDTLSNILTQVQVSHFLNDTTAAGQYDVAGAFLWSWDLCSSPTAPGCTAGGSGSGGFGGFGGFVVPEPSTATLLLGGLVLLAGKRRTRVR